MRFVSMVRFNMRLSVGGLLRRLVGGDHVHLGAGNAAARHFAHFQARTYIQCGDRLLKMGKGNAGVNQCAQQHVATYAGETIQIANTHRKRF